MIGIDHLRPGRLRWSGGDDATTDDEAEPDARQRVRARGDVGRRERDSFRAPAPHRPRRLAPPPPCPARGVSRLTVRPALEELVREGYLVRRRGSGTYVSEPKIAQELTLTSFSDDMRRRGMRPASKTLSLETTMAGAYLGRCLHVSPSEKIVVAKRLRLADTETMAI